MATPNVLILVKYNYLQVIEHARNGFLVSFHSIIADQRYLHIGKQYNDVKNTILFRYQQQYHTISEKESYPRLPVMETLCFAVLQKIRC
jgi:hypothetical protein